jgi:hypothetical protein
MDIVVYALPKDFLIQKVWGKDHVKSLDF